MPKGAVESGQILKNSAETTMKGKDPEEQEEQVAPFARAKWASDYSLFLEEPASPLGGFHYRFDYVCVAR